MQDYAGAHQLTTDIVDLQETGDGNRLLWSWAPPRLTCRGRLARRSRVLHNPDDAELGRAARAPD